MIACPTCAEKCGKACRVCGWCQALGKEEEAEAATKLRKEDAIPETEVD